MSVISNGLIKLIKPYRNLFKDWIIFRNFFISYSHDNFKMKGLGEFGWCLNEGISKKKVIRFWA